MALLFTNNAISTLAAGFNAGSTSLTVQAGDGALFPNPTGNDSFLVTLQDASNNIEIVECTSRSTDALTVVRAQEGTADQNWLSGDAVELRITAGVLSQYRQGVGDAVVDTAINKSLGAADVHDIINATVSGITITLLSAATAAEGYQVTVKNESTGPITVDRANAADTIDGVLQDLQLGPGQSIRLSVNQSEDGYVSLAGSAQAAWPVGSVYLSVTATNPATTLGFGTWAQIAQGRTLIGEGTGAGLTARTAGATGGREDAVIVDHDHNITDPGHTHTIPSNEENSNLGGTNSVNSRAVVTNDSTNSSTTGITVDEVDPAGIAAAETIVATGADENMQPYLVVYIWERTA